MFLGRAAAMYLCSLLDLTWKVPELAVAFEKASVRNSKTRETASEATARLEALRADQKVDSYDRMRRVFGLVEKMATHHGVQLEHAAYSFNVLEEQAA